ncbi:hypothetical protein [Bradyrhizobium sp. AUGA SZCCT0182]|uniref:hypothetical protein n=1 Tax=Bradyrhizobium sp. AUGA SZCCT0182 TaxID=2807667 RepID=UPI001BA5E132|nr:hypothetical protein [Bradyrhizobium sp. AUGA SZCCT0182]MBR1231967.1 hypothetical protein [Bradyrhizobium sp. AUGA SZCCT0182]
MTRKPPSFHKPDLVRAVAGIRKAGEEIELIEIQPDGTIKVHTTPRPQALPEKAA